MKFKRTIYFLAFLLAACAQLGLPTAQTFDQKLLVAYGTVGAVKKTTLSLLNADKIDVKDAENVQTQTDNVQAALDVSRGLAKTDLTAANNKLSATITILTALQSYLATKGKK